MRFFTAFRAFLLLTFPLFSHQLEVELLAKNAILINPENNAILYENNARQKAFPASITKIATALYVLDKKKDLLDKSFTVSGEAIRYISPSKKDDLKASIPSYYLETDGVSFGLLKGEIISGRALLYSMMIVSGNDCANVLAESASGSIPLFMNELNLYLKSLGCVITHFSNPHGLHYIDHYTTAYEMALIAKKALSFPAFRQVVSTLSCTISKTNLHEARKISPFNRLLKKKSEFYYPYAIGVKTGYHSKAGYNLVAAAKYGERTLIAVVLGEEKSEYRYEDAIKLFEAAFSEVKEKKTIFNEGAEFKASIKGASTNLTAYVKEGLSYKYFPAEEMPFKVVIKWNDLSLPIKKDALVGEIQIISNDELVLESSCLFAKEKIKRNFVQSFKDIFSRFF